MWYLGIDPGHAGGLSLVNHDGLAVEYERMGDIGAVNKFFRRALDMSGGELIVVFEESKGGGEITNAAAHLSAGRYLGIVQTLCTVHNLQLVTVTPQTWKSHFKLIQKTPKGAPKVPVAEKRKLAKAASCALAKKLFPTVNLVFPRCSNEHDGVAESLLIAAYGREKGLKL